MSGAGHTVGPLTASDLAVGGWYCGKRNRSSRYHDRRIIWMESLDTGEHRRLQYDSDTVANGRNFPSTTAGAFLRWASHRINSDGTPYSGTPT